MLTTFLSWRVLRWTIPLYLVLLLLLWGVMLMQWSGGGATRDSTGTTLGPDFMAFYTGARFVLSGQNRQLYDLAAQAAFQERLDGPRVGVSGFVNPPQWAIMVAPLGWLSYRAAFTIWTIAMLGCFVASVWLMRPFLPALASRWGTTTALALGSAPVYFAASAGQNTGLSLLLHVAILRALPRRRDVLAGLLIALGCVKPQFFLALLPLLVLARRWRAVGSALAGLAVVAALGTLVVGPASWPAWIKLTMSTLQVEQQRQIIKLFSWQPFWALLLGRGVVATTLGWLCVAFTACILAWLWLQPMPDEPLRYAVTVLGIMLISPHMPIYDLGLLVLPVLVLADRILSPQIQSSRLIHGTQALLLALYITVFFYEQVHYTHVQLVVPLIMATLIAGVLLLRPLAAPFAITRLFPSHGT
ncbi:MAG: DUF2029 domain-containing protein [Herpetosiphonaceae bacterium]|nr:DUF2029 domain-containing protein [Herpetosiphonaceae bacterium]